MKRITKKYIRGSSYPVYTGNGITSYDLKKVMKFVDPRSNEVRAIFSKIV